MMVLMANVKNVFKIVIFAKMPMIAKYASKCIHYKITKLVAASLDNLLTLLLYVKIANILVYNAKIRLKIVRNV